MRGIRNRTLAYMVSGSFLVGTAIGGAGTWYALSGADTALPKERELVAEMKYNDSIPETVDNTEIDRLKRVAEVDELTRMFRTIVANQARMMGKDGIAYEIENPLKAQQFPAFMQAIEPVFVSY